MIGFKQRPLTLIYESSQVYSIVKPLLQGFVSQHPGAPYRGTPIVVGAFSLILGLRTYMQGGLGLYYRDQTAASNPKT